MKLAVIVRCLLVLATALGLGACAAPHSTGMTADPTVALPVIFDKIWYRTEKVRVLGLAYEATGQLMVREDSLEFTHPDGTVKVSASDIQRVTWGKLSPDMMNDWIIVILTPDTGPGALVAFKGALFSGTDDNQVYSAILRAASAK